MSTLHFNLNRPVHLARRDVFFETALELIETPVENVGTPDRLARVDRVISLLKTARSHALFASRSPDATPLEREFLHFLELLSDNAQAIHAMLDHQSHLEAEQGFLRRFLGVPSDQAGLPAMDYKRRAEDILQGLLDLVKLARHRYREMKSGDSESLSEENRVRYEKASRSFREELAARFGPAAATNAQTSGPVPQSS